jgi:hypothetical protein
LFRRFQRTVEAIDKKDNFPAPSVRQRNRPQTAVPHNVLALRAMLVVGKAVAQGIDAEKKVISQSCDIC